MQISARKFRIKNLEKLNFYVVYIKIRKLNNFNNFIKMKSYLWKQMTSFWTLANLTLQMNEIFEILTLYTFVCKYKYNCPHFIHSSRFISYDTFSLPYWNAIANMTKLLYIIQRFAYSKKLFSPLLFFQFKCLKYRGFVFHKYGIRSFSDYSVSDSTFFTKIQKDQFWLIDRPEFEHIFETKPGIV